MKTEQQTKEQHLRIKNSPSFQAKNAKFWLGVHLKISANLLIVGYVQKYNL